MLQESRATYFSPDDDVQSALLAFVQTATPQCLRHVAPRQVTNDLPDALVGHTETARNRGNRLSRRVPLSHLDHIRRCQSRVPVMFSGRPVRPALSHAVLDVLSLRPKKQVVGIEAGRVVATMADEQPRCQIQTQPQCRSHAVNPDRHAVEAHPAIAVAVSATSPEPTSGDRINLAVTKQAGFGRQDALRVVTVMEHRNQPFRCHASGCSQHRRGIFMSSGIISLKREETDA